MKITQSPHVWKRNLVAVVLSLATVPLVAQSAGTSDTILVQENAFWKAYIDGDTAALSKLLLPDFISVEEQIWNRDQVFNFVKQFHAQCTLAPVNLLDPHVSFLTPEIATVVYHATETPTCGGHTMSGETNISTVWVRREGRWQMHIHTEYAVPPK